MKRFAIALAVGVASLVMSESASAQVVIVNPSYGQGGYYRPSYPVYGYPSYGYSQGYSYAPSYGYGRPSYGYGRPSYGYPSYGYGRPGYGYGSGYNRGYGGSGFSFGFSTFR